jgi:hypothetical protein
MAVCQPTNKKHKRLGMLKPGVILMLALFCAAMALEPGVVVFQNEYPAKGMETDYDLKDTFTYGVDTDINGRCYYAEGKTLGQLVQEILAENPDSGFKDLNHVMYIYLDPASGCEPSSNYWITTPGSLNMDWNQAGCYYILPPQEDAWGGSYRDTNIHDLNSYGALGVHGTHKVVYSVVLDFNHRWNAYTGEWEEMFSVTISEGTFKWVIP